MKKPVSLSLTILNTSKKVIYDFWYDNRKLKYGKKTQLCYMDTETFIVHIKIGNIAKDLETRFDTSNDELGHYLEEKQKVIRLM